MQRFLIITLAVLGVIATTSCGSSSKDGNATITDKKAELQKLKSQVQKLEDELAKIDTAGKKTEKEKLVAITTLKQDTFTHFIELQGKIESENISYVTPRGGPAQVKALYIKRGDAVKKGQLLMKLDDAVSRQAMNTAEQGVNTVKTQLDYAQNIYQKQKNLWDQHIGTEVQLITAKNNVQNLENQLKTAQEQANMAKEQWQFSNVYSDVEGVAEDVNIRVGETFSGLNQVKIVNISHLKATAQVPENYLDRVRVGTNVKILLPDLNKTLDAKVNVAGKSIDPLNRSFFIEARIPTSPDLKPNQVAQIRIQDYTINNTITVPVNTIQSDESGKFVMTAATENGKLVARKKPVVIGEFYGDKMEIKNGLKAGDVIVTDGFQTLYEGQPLTTDSK